MPEWGEMEFSSGSHADEAPLPCVDLWGFDLNMYLYKRWQTYLVFLYHLALKFMTLLFYNGKGRNGQARRHCNEKNWMVKTLWCLPNRSFLMIPHRLHALVFVQAVPTNKELPEFKGAKVSFSPLQSILELTRYNPSYSHTSHFKHPTLSTYTLSPQIAYIPLGTIEEVCWWTHRGQTWFEDSFFSSKNGISSNKIKSRSKSGHIHTVLVVLHPL